MKRRRLSTSLLIGIVVMAAASAQRFEAQGQGGQGENEIRHVLLISIDGMHAVDFLNCTQGINGINGINFGNPYCPNLAALASTGINYTEARTSKPSDSFPGILALVAGASPRTSGVYYDVSYTRELAPPGGPCTVNVPGPGTDVVYDENLDFSLANLAGGGGIDPKLTLDPLSGCKPVYPHNFVRVNTIFGVLHSHARYTAWSDKHPAYDIVRGHTPIGVPNNNVDDLNSPEINSVVAPVSTVP